MLLGDVEERIKLLRQCNQSNIFIFERIYRILFLFNIESLAYVMAATHGLDEQAEQIKDSLDENVIYYFKNKLNFSDSGLTFSIKMT